MDMKIDKEFYKVKTFLIIFLLNMGFRKFIQRFYHQKKKYLIKIENTENLKMILKV